MTDGKQGKTGMHRKGEAGQEVFTLTDDQWQRVYIMAGWYDAMAVRTGTTSPSNPLVCLLLAAESLQAYVESELGGLDRVRPI